MCWDCIAIATCFAQLLFLYSLSKKQVKETIQSIAMYQKRSTYEKCCWYVNEAVLAKHGLTNLPVPNSIHDTGTPAKAPSHTPEPSK